LFLEVWSALSYQRRLSSHVVCRMVLQPCQVAFQAPQRQWRSLTISIPRDLATQVAGNAEEPRTECAITTITLLLKGAMSGEKDILRHLFRSAIGTGG
jgi:hypothetical protein